MHEGWLWLVLSNSCFWRADLILTVFLPLTLSNYGRNCYNEVWNGGFEKFLDGKPLYWSVYSSDGYPLADGTWFASGHYGAYLGGYDNANDILMQYIYIPLNFSSAILSYEWYMQTEETDPLEYDYMYVRLYNTSGNLVKELHKVSNLSARGVWQKAMFDLSSDLRPYSGQWLLLSFEAKTDFSNPTSFFLDNVSLWICWP